MPVQIPAPASLTQAYSYYTRVTGGTWPYIFSLAEGSAPLPAGITLNTVTGELNGTPTVAGQYSFSIGVSDSVSAPNTGYSEVTLSLNVAAPLNIATATLPSGEAASAYTATLTKTGGSGNVTFAVTSGALPAGLTLNSSSGVISGTPSVLGTASFTITATDAFGRTAAKSLSITIAPTLAISTTRLNDTLVGNSYSQTLTGSGGQLPYSWEIVSGTLPTGLVLNPISGEISGTATVAGSPSITFGMRDATNRLTTKVLTLNAITPLGMAASLPNAIAGSPYSQSAVTGGLAPFSCSVSGGILPAGLTLNSSTCVVSGISSATAFNNFAIAVTDSTWPTPQSASKSLSIRTLPATFTLSADFTGSGSGSIHSSPVTGISCIKNAISGCSAPFATGSVVTLTATADSSTSTFGGWDVCNVNPCDITISGNKTATASFTLAPRSKLDLAATSGYDSLPLAYGSAVSTIFALEGLFTGEWALDGGKDITLKGGYLADYGPVRNGFTTVGGKLTVSTGSLRVDGVNVK